MKTNAHFWQCLAAFFSEKEIFRTKVVEKIKVNFLCSINFFFENRALYEIMWRNMLERDRLQKTIWRMRFACWVTKTRDTHTLMTYNNYCSSTTTMVTRTRLNVTFICKCILTLLLKTIFMLSREEDKQKNLWTFRLQEWKLSWHYEIWVATSCSPVHQGFGEIVVSICRVEISSSVWNWNIGLPLASNNKIFIMSFVKSDRPVQ